MSETRKSHSGKPPAWLEQETAGTALLLRVKPGASKDEIVEVKDGRLWIRVQSPPVEGAANKGLLKFLAKALGTSKSKVVLAKGEKSRDKRVVVVGLNPARVQDIIEKLMR